LGAKPVRFSKEQVQAAAAKAVDRATRQEGRKRAVAFLMGAAFGVAAAWVFGKAYGI
jgi:hypothetical protein